MLWAKVTTSYALCWASRYPGSVPRDALTQGWISTPAAPRLSIGVAVSEIKHFKISPALEEWPGGKAL